MSARYAVAVLALGAAHAAQAFPGMEKGVKPAAPVEGTAGALPSGHPPLGGAPSDHKHELGKEKGTLRVRAQDPDGKPVPNLSVSLLITLHGEPKGRHAGRTDGRGVAVFADIPRDDHASYTAVAPYSGVNYYAQLAFDKGKRQGEGLLRVAPSTKDPKGLRVGRAHLVVEPTRERIRITEVLLLVNPGKASYAGEPLVIPLFHGAQDLRAEAAVPGTYELSGHDLRYRGFVRPGQTQIQYQYVLGLTGIFERKTVLPIDGVFVVLTNPRFQLKGPDFKGVQEMSRGSTKFLLAESKPVPAGGSIRFEIAPPREMMGRMEGGAGAGERGAAGAAKGELVKDWHVVAKWLSPLFLMFIFFLAVYLASRRDDGALLVADEAALAAERDRLLPELAAVTRRAEGGEKAALRKQAELTRRLADVYRRLDEHAARKALSGAAAADKPAR